MDLISKAVSDIKAGIPRAMLKLAYDDKYMYRMRNVSLDEQIKRKTIYGRVIPDTHVIGGETIYVDLTNMAPLMVDQHNYYYEIPGKALNYRTILTPLSAHYMSFSSVLNTMNPGLAYQSTTQANDIGAIASRAFDSNANIPIVSNPECQNAGHNVVMIRNHILNANTTFLKVMVTNDANLENIDIRSAPQFSKLCTFAAKAFIYNELFEKLDQGRLENGHEIGVVKDYWSGLSDAEQNYLDYRDNVWAEVLTHNDRLVLDDYLKLMVDPSI